jgi:hypothetical protein
MAPLAAASWPVQGPRLAKVRLDRGRLERFRVEN